MLRIILAKHLLSAILHALLARLAGYLSVYHAEHIHHSTMAQVHRNVANHIEGVIAHRAFIARLNKQFPPAW